MPRKGIDPPNPRNRIHRLQAESKYLSGSKVYSRKNDRPNHDPPVSGQYISSTRKMVQKFDPLDSVKVEHDFDFRLGKTDFDIAKTALLGKTDLTCSKYKVKLEPEEPYNNVYWSNFEQAWIGSYETLSGRILTVKSHESALNAAKKLNSACRDACTLSSPNPTVGFLTNDEAYSHDFLIKDMVPPQNFLIKAEPLIDDSFKDDFQDLFKPINNDLNPSRTHLSLETVELPPPILDEEDFKSMNNLMFKYISDYLPEHTRKQHQHQNRTSLFDDLPLSSILL
eukprot:TRINITY_DN146_c0_g1_i3.p1 TRINITY_DN146_c0_g1~~TRINITY_DN146_c0_g1_i3.p1  ORF type:complete len:282 (-),score=33.79 TRINITY_DN146_c0_g1_i3:360-1205(-)